MASIKFLIKSDSNPANVYCRYVNTRAIDLVASVNILVNPKHWDNKNGRFRALLEAKNHDAHNKKLRLLENHIHDSYNEAFMSGEVIDKQWLDKTIATFFNRPKDEVKKSNKNHTIYYTDYAQYWLDEIASTWLSGENKYMDEPTKERYQTFLNMVKEFEGKTKIKLTDTDNTKINEFVHWLAENDYNVSTIKRHVSRFKFFCLRAEADNLNINKGFKLKVFPPKETKIKHPYLNEKEITAIFNHDFSDTPHLDNVRDNLIIACWSGLRVSDFLSRLSIENFIDDFIEITTQKTKTPVVIPLHPMVKKILIKRNGRLPDKISDQKFNVYVKEVCKEVKLKQKMKGKLMDSDKKRKVVGEFEKYKLVSSHIGRRSFVTNLIGKIDDNTLMAIGGWSTKEVMYDYAQTTNIEHANKLKKHWEDIYN